MPPNRTARPRDSIYGSFGNLEQAFNVVAQAGQPIDALAVVVCELFKVRSKLVAVGPRSEQQGFELLQSANVDIVLTRIDPSPQCRMFRATYSGLEHNHAPPVGIDHCAQSIEKVVAVRPSNPVEPSRCRDLVIGAGLKLFDEHPTVEVA